MTPEETELRELDAWIAGNIFNRGNDGYYCSVCRECVATDTVTSGGYHQKCGGAVSAGFPFYSTNPADALAVLDECLHDGADVLIMSFENEDAGKSYSVCESGDKAGECFPTLPLAICRFAKKLFER